MNSESFIEAGGVTVAICGAFVVASCFLNACPPATPAVTPDASDAAIVVDSAPKLDSTPPSAVVDAAPPAPTCANANAACDHMKAAGCREGSVADCARVLCLINGDPHFKHYDLSCVAAATNMAAIKACGADCTP